MLDLMTTADNKIVSALIARAGAAYESQDSAGVEHHAQRALAIALRVNDWRGACAADLLVGIARRDVSIVARAGRIFVRAMDWLNAAIAMCYQAALTHVEHKRLEILHKALAHFDTAKMRLAQRGDNAKWHAVTKVEREVHRTIEITMMGGGQLSKPLDTIP